MQQNSNIPEQLHNINYLVGDEKYLLGMQTVAVKPVFDEQVIGFLGALSKTLMHMPAAKAYSDVMSYAFWIRKQSLMKEQERFADKKKLGRGIAFHIAPSNVAVNFAVSFTSAILAGNPCIVRVSNKEFAQVDMIVDAINQVMDAEYPDMRNYLCIVRYEHNDGINAYLSSICDIRIVWGGNRTLQEMRRFPIPPRAIEMAFPDRHSIAVVNADVYLKEDEKKIADLFYIDTYFTDQNACSSPRLIIWTGDKVAEARKRFFDALMDKLNTSYEMAPILAIDKWNAFCELAATHDGVSDVSENNILMRIEMQTLFADMMDYKMGGGYFFEYVTDNLADMVPVLTKSCQTISYLGVDPQAIRQVVSDHGVRGVDRIVPMGHTMDLSFFWDGYDMMDAMSRYVQLM